MDIKKSIRVALATKALNQNDLAAALGMSPSSVSQMLARESITSKNIEKIAAALQMKASELVALGED